MRILVEKCNIFCPILVIIPLPNTGSQRDISRTSQESTVPIHPADRHALLASAGRAGSTRWRRRRVPAQRSHCCRCRSHRHQERGHALLDLREITVRFHIYFWIWILELWLLQLELNIFRYKNGGNQAKSSIHYNTAFLKIWYPYLCD